MSARYGKILEKANGIAQDLVHRQVTDAEASAAVIGILDRIIGAAIQRGEPDLQKRLRDARYAFLKDLI